MTMLLYLLFLSLPLSGLTHNREYPCKTNAPCGCSAERAILSKVIDGETVIKRSWGWMVSLREYRNSTHFCGGSILSNSWILTAAHCVVGLKPSKVTIHGGSLYLPYSSQQRKVRRIISHPNFNSVTFVNDIALIQLSSSLDMNDPDLAKICLPAKPIVVDDPIDGDASTNEYPPVNSELIAIGWGQRVAHIQVVSDELQQVTLRAVASDSESCDEIVSSQSQQFCAGADTGSKDTCQGDSGGPLMKFSPTMKRWILAGITSAGYECGNNMFASLYTRVEFYSDWINATIKRYDRSGDSIVTVNDYSNDPEFNTCARYRPSAVLFIVISTYLSLHFCE